jgi:hypothetical protein
MNKKITNILAISILLLTSLPSHSFLGFFEDNASITIDEVLIKRHKIIAMKINNKFVHYSKNSTEKQYSDKWPYDDDANQRPYGSIAITKNSIVIVLDENRDNRLSFEDGAMMLDIVKIFNTGDLIVLQADEYNHGDKYTFDNSYRLRLKLAPDWYEFWLEKD